MKTIDLTCGTHIDRAALQLVAAAPARATFNGIPIRAKYATTSPRDIVARFNRLCDERSLRYLTSAEGRRHAADDARDIATKQVTVNRLLASLPDFADCSTVVTWCGAFFEAADRVGVDFDRPWLIQAFIAGGWSPAVNIGEDCDVNDPRNFAGYIVGQMLVCYAKIGACPGVIHSFIADWQARFGATGSGA